MDASYGWAMDDLSEVLGKIVAEIVAHKDPEKVLLCGSRARKDHTPRSDIDIAIVDETWTREDIALVHDRVEGEVSTPLKTDLLAYHLLRRGSVYERTHDQRN